MTRNKKLTATGLEYEKGKTLFQKLDALITVKAPFDHCLIEGTMLEGSPLIPLANGAFVYHSLRDWARWATGDAINRAHAETLMSWTLCYKAAASATGKSIRWMAILAKTSRVFPHHTRAATLPWQLYRTCADAPQPQKALNWAIETEADAKEVKRLMQITTDNGGNSSE